MIHSNNPLAHGNIDEELDDVQLYGYDPEASLLQKKIIMSLLCQFL